MGLLDSVLGGAMGAIGQAGGVSQASLLQAVSGLLAGNANGGNIGGGASGGGLAALVLQFSQGGLGAVVQSWVGSGANLPILAEQVQSVLSSEQLGAMARQTGLSHSDLASQLAQLLPQVVDHLTPNGEMPHGSTDLGSMVSGLLGGLLRR